MKYRIILLAIAAIAICGCGKMNDKHKVDHSVQEQAMSNPYASDDAGTVSNPHNYPTIGDIPVPEGFQRIGNDDPGFAEYLRSLKLKGRGAKVKYYTGGDSGMQDVCYAVVDKPLLSNAEQCADVCMHLRAEYLFSKGYYTEISFRDVSGTTMHYTQYAGGPSNKSFGAYLRRVYNRANTYSLSRDMATRQLKDIQPGDVFVFPARRANSLGHAIMVADVAKNLKNGKKAFLLIQGFTPAMDIHVLRNQDDSSLSPWYMLDENAEEIDLAGFAFQANQLKHFSEVR